MHTCNILKTAQEHESLTFALCQHISILVDITVMGTLNEYLRIFRCPSREILTFIAASELCDYHN
jgi:hypothetical protein